MRMTRQRSREFKALASRRRWVTGARVLTRAAFAIIAVALSTHVVAALPGAVELDSSPEELSDARLAALLDSHVASADVVALGETVHGSSGLLRIQTRLIRYLVMRHGLRLIAWENPALRSIELSRWVSSCTKAKTPAPIAVLYMPTASDLPFFDWVCDFNRSHPDDPIVFRGIDIWDRPWEHYARIHDLSRRLAVNAAASSAIAKTCPASRSSSWADIEVALARGNASGNVFGQAEYEPCRTALTALLEDARLSASAKRKAKDPAADDAFELALSASTMLGWLGFYHYNWSDDVLSWNARDSAQAMNLLLLMEKHGARRSIVAAHTSHVSHNRSRADWWGFGDIKSAVHFFESLTAKKAFSIALTAYDASGPQGHWSTPTARNSLDRKLHEAGHTFAFFPATAAFLSEHPRWWMQNQNAPPFENGVELVPKDHFDAYFFLDRSYLDRALPARPMHEP